MQTRESSRPRLGTNVFFREWKRKLASMKRLSSAIGGPSWEQLQTTESVAASNIWYRQAHRLAIDNPRFAEAYSTYRRWRKRLRRHYAYSVPSDEALDYIKSLGGSILELESGKAYWAKLLLEKGVDIVPTDLRHAEQNPWVDGQAFTEVIQFQVGVDELFERFSPTIVMVQWPNERMSYVRDLLCKREHSVEVILVGEQCSIDKGTRELHKTLVENSWRLKKKIALPRFLPIHDSLRHYVR